jgi:hypothetical protein
VILHKPAQKPTGAKIMGATRAARCTTNIMHKWKYEKCICMIFKTDIPFVKKKKEKELLGLVQQASK